MNVQSTWVEIGFLTYRGYVGKCTFEDGLWQGEALFMTDTIHFQGKTKAAAAKSFQDSVNDYLAFCKERGEQPEVYQ